MILGSIDRKRSVGPFRAFAGDAATTQPRAMLRAGALALVVAVAGPACVPDVGRQDRTTETYRSILEAEDARPVEQDALASLIAAAQLQDALLRRTALRTLGRLERPSLAPAIAAHLDDPDPAVRATAAWALTQSVHRSDGAAALEALVERVPLERDVRARGALAEAIGRLSLDDAERRRAYDAVLALSAGVEGSAPAETLEGVALALEALVRGAGEGGIPGPVAAKLDELFSYRPPGDSATAGRIRALALSSLGPPRRVGLEHMRRALADDEAEVRRVAVAYLSAIAPSARAGLLEQALADPSPRVVIAAIRRLSGIPRTTSSCRQLIAAAEPGMQPAVRVQALAALARPCPGSTTQRRALTAAASELGDATDSAWQPAVSALTALASVDPDAAARLLARFAAHASPFVRAHAARAAGQLGDIQTLDALAGDDDANVRTAALEPLFELRGHAIDELLIAQLSFDDPQLLITVAGLLEGSPSRAGAGDALFAAFARISAAERETWRDPRRALLERISELDARSLAPELDPYLRDYDPVVAGDIARLVDRWTGGSTRAAPEPLPPARFPSLGELETLDGTTVTLHLSGGRSLVIETRPDVALTNVHRFVRLARAGYYDGLTFHRWAPNFVIQGGSPGANEYAGDGPYTRDEVGPLSHWRGTVGISTRGRDTGDAQIFVNLVHNVRLDRDYTVIGSLVGGLDVLDTVLEGTVIERAEVR